MAKVIVNTGTPKHRFLNDVGHSALSLRLPLNTTPDASLRSRFQHVRRKLAHSFFLYLYEFQNLSNSVSECGSTTITSL